MLQRKKRSICKAVRLFALSIGTAAVCTLASLGLFDPSPAALEASAFNGGNAFRACAVRTEQTEAAVPETVTLLGTAFGIRLFTDGVIVASLSDIYTPEGLCCPAAEAGIRPGDYVLEADGVPVGGNAQLAGLIGRSAGGPMVLTVKRGADTFEASVTPVWSGGSFKTGMWIRDSAAGIGTLTFYDPAAGRFAGLGHGICDMDAGGVMALKSGEPAPIALCGVDRGEPGEPGRLKGYFASEDSLGTLLINDETGVYGTLDAAPRGETVEVLTRDKVKCGPVQIMATLDETGPMLYEGEIRRVSAGNQRTKNLVVKVTDPRLLAVTGGIVQGMSGCPILQDGKLAGAVTHVFTDDPSSGYGIFAQTMCEVLAGQAA